MINLNFKINKKYLLVHALNSSQPLPFDSFVNLQNKLWKKFPTIYYLFANPAILYIQNEDTELLNINKEDYKNFFMTALSSAEFKKLFSETEKYLKFVKNQWTKNSKITLKKLTEITGLEIPKLDITVLLTHPNLRNGQSYHSLKTIAWGHPEDYKNYSTIYLCHELLHMIIPIEYQRDSIMEYLVRLSADYELNRQLNNKAVDIKNIAPAKIAKRWEQYINNKLKGKNNLSIIDLYKELK